ncbi:MAG: VPLPA-CTERM sorting domain-containing protein [Gammaproteobacteria bacterium]|nr:VPLPA-CTERM sorting domain-containing protein [Gammaproteobacteria bacterium]
MKLGKRWFTALLVATALPVQAAIFTADTVEFDWTPSSSDLFGIPTTDGDSLVFSPSAFTATSVDDSFVQITSDIGTISITPLAGFVLTSISVVESGTYELSDSDRSVAVAGELLLVGGSATDIVTAAALDTTGAETAWSAGTGDVAVDPNLAVASISNILTAFSATVGGDATISKGEARIVVTTGPDTSPVPLPAAAWLLAGGLAALGLTGRRPRG